MIDDNSINLLALGDGNQSLALGGGNIAVAILAGPSDAAATLAGPSDINFEGGLEEKQIPGTDSQAMFSGSAGPITGLERMGQVEVFEESVPVFDEGAIAQKEIPLGPLTGPDGEFPTPITRSKSSAKETDSLTGEAIEESDVASATLRDRPTIQPRKGLKNFLNPTLGKSSFAIENFFDSGYFVVGETGKITVNNLYDGSRLKGETAIFSLEGIDEKTFKNRFKFIKEASRRALTNSELGHVIIADRSTGVHFKSRHNRNKSSEPQTFEMKPGEKFGIMLVPNGTVREVFENPKARGRKRPIFSLFGKGKGPNFSKKLIAEVMEDSGIFGWENTGKNRRRSDFRDNIFHLEGAEGVVQPIDKLIGPKFKWRSGKLGKQFKEYFDSKNPPELNLDDDSFIVSQNGEVKINYLFDGSENRGELAVFSLKDLETLNLKSYEDFIKEAATRASSNSEMGYVVVSDREEGAELSGRLKEENANNGKYLGEKTFKMNPGDKIAFMLVPNGRVAELLNKQNSGDVGDVNEPLFSFAVITENNSEEPPKQMVGLNGDGKVYGFEDRLINNKSDRDYNDLIISVEGLEGKKTGTLLKQIINPQQNWLGEELADELINYSSSTDFEITSDRFYGPKESISIWGNANAASSIEKIDLQLQKDGGNWQDISDITEFQKHPTDSNLVRFDYDLTEEFEPGKYQLIAVGYDAKGRAIKTVNQNFTVLSLPEDYVLSSPVKAALEEAIDLDASYNPGTLAGNQEWVVKVKDDTSAQKLAAEVGADNLGSTGHIPDTYVFEFPEDVEPLEVAGLLDLSSVELAYQPSIANVGLLGIPNDPQFKQQWHLQNTDKNGGTPEVDLNVTEVWDEYRGEGVVIATVDDGLEKDHPDLKDRYEKDLSWDFNEGDPDPSHNSTVAYGRDRFLNFLEKDKALRYFETPQDLDSFLQETVTNDKISFVLPTSLMGLLEKVNLNLTVPDGASLPEDLQVYFYAPNNPPKSRGRHYWGGTLYNYGWIRWPGWEGLGARQRVPLDLSKPDRKDGKGNSIYDFDIDKFEDKQAGGYWSLEIVDNKNNYSKTELEQIAEQIRNSWDWTLELNAVNPHGTAVAGIAAATGDNNEGVSGVAPEATLAGLRLIGDVEPIQQAGGQTIADAFFDEGRNREIDIFNNSWAPEYFRRQPLVLNALQAGFSRGRNGLGNNYVFAAGNDGALGGNVNYNYLANSRHVIAVGAVDYNGKYASYTTPGASVLVSALSNNDKAGISTTDLTGSSGYSRGDYNSDFGGTSAAAPQVAGTIALMLEANPLLTARDVQHILVETANRDRLDNNGVNWSGDADADVRHSYKYGFGLVDAKAAVEAAETWESDLGEFSPEERLEFNLTPTVGEIPDNDDKGVSDAVEVKEELDIEWVEVEFDATHSYRSDLEVVLAHTYTDAETGEEKTTESLLTSRNSWSGENYDKWTFASARHWGETSAGTWELRVSDLNPKTRPNTTGGTWHSWKLNIYGNSDTTARKPNEPPELTNISTLTGATEGEAFTISYEDLLAASDATDADGDTLTFQIEELLSGSLTKDGETVAPSATVLAAGEEIVWTPGETGDAVKALSVKAFDGTESSDAVEVAIAVSADNAAPTLTNISTLTGATEGEAFTISYEDLLAASDATDADGDTLTFQIEELLSGSLTKDGETVALGESVLAGGEEIVWTPEETGDAVKALSVKAFDGTESSDAVEVAIAVSADNTAPTLTNISTLTGATEGEAFTISYEDLLAASDATDADGDTLTFQIEELLSGSLTLDGETVALGETVLAAGEEIVWTPGETGDAVKALSVKAFDGTESSDAVEVAIAVSADNTAPTLTNISTLTGATEGEAFTISYEDLLAASNAADADGDTLTFQIEELLSGSLTKDGETVAPSATVLAGGEEIVWTPGETGDAVKALSVKAFDGTESSDAVEVAIAVEADSPAITGGKVTVTVHRVREIDNMDLDLFGNNDADFFTQLEINGTQWQSSSMRNQNDTSPNWQFSRNVTGTSVPITIEMYEENSGLFPIIDLVDINPLSGTKTLNLTYNLETGTISGPGVSGKAGEVINLRGGGDDLRAEIWFSIDVE